MTERNDYNTEGDDYWEHKTNNKQRCDGYEKIQRVIKQEYKVADNNPFQNELDNVKDLETTNNEAEIVLGKTEKAGIKPSKSFKSGISKDTVETGSTQEEELRDLSSTLRVSDEDFGRIVSPPESPIFQTNRIPSLRKPDFEYRGYQGDMMELEDLKQTLKNELDHLKMLQAVLQASEEERNDLNAKLATLRVKLGVANANYNVSKTESDQLRKQNQEAQIQKARLEERISVCTVDLEKLKDPANPDSNVNLRKVAANDRKEVKRLRNELEGIKSERSETHKQIEVKDEKIRQLEMQIVSVKEQLDTCQSDLDVAIISAEAERKEREEIEVKLNELIGEKMKFDDRMLKVQTRLNSTASGTTGIQKQVGQFKEKEQKLLQSIATTEKKLRDAVTEIEQLKNRGMPARIASSIKHHQYRMSRNSMVSDTTPRFSLGSKGSIASSGSLGSKLSVASFATSKSSVGQPAAGFKSSIGQPAAGLKPSVGLPAAGLKPLQKGLLTQPTGPKSRPINGKSK